MKKYIKIATEYETIFNGFRVPVGACYCKNNNTRFVCMDYSGLKKRNSLTHCLTFMSV